MIEAELIIRAQAGEATAWHALIRQHQTAVFRLAYLLLRDVDDAEDVAQETFIRAFRNLARFDTARPLRPWLLEITRNQCYNWQRAWRRRWAAWQRWGTATQQHDSTLAPQSSSTHAASPHEQVQQQWQATLLWQAVRRLSDADQEIIYLRCFLELSIEESAQVLNVASGTIKSRLSRALARLREVVIRDYPDLHTEAHTETFYSEVTE